MPAPAWENLDDFLSTDDFATLAIFTPAGGQPRPGVAVIFDEPVMNAESGEYDFAAAEPRFTCKEADVVGLKKHDGCVIGGKEYELERDPHPDGTGMAVVILAPALEVAAPF